MVSPFTPSLSPAGGKGRRRELLFNRNEHLLAAFDINPYSKFDELSIRSLIPNPDIEKMDVANHED